jgi:hypothetical protein
VLHTAQIQLIVEEHSSLQTKIQFFMLGGFTPVGHDFAALRRAAHHYIKIMMIPQYPIANY